MRYFNDTLVNATAATDQTTEVVDTRQVAAITFQCSMSAGATSTGDVYLDGSNDPAGTNLTPSNWSELTTATIADGDIGLLIADPSPFMWMRVRYVVDTVGTGTITIRPKSIGF
jgi:hypothetical protein